MSEQPSKHRVVIVGGGFGGLATARALKKADVEVTLVDKRNHHLFQPLLYQVATAGLSAVDIAAPIRNLLAKQKNARVLLGRVERVDTKKKSLILRDSEIPYDTLVLAAGMTNSYFGHPEWETVAPGLKSLEEALEMLRRVLLAYEAAECEQDPQRKKAWLTFVVIGGGATGVELAGALREIAAKTLLKNFRTFDSEQARVILLEGGPRLLPAMPERLSAKALADLLALGVEVRLNSPAKDITEAGVTLKDETIESRTVLWGAGVRGVPLAESLGVGVDRQGRLAVDSHMRVTGVENVYAIGDLAAFRQENGEMLPGVAQVAMQQGAHVGKQIMAFGTAREVSPFVYRDLGSMATIGRSSAVASIGKLQLTGFVAWLAWLFVHLMALVGFRNRLAVFMEWAWAYVSYERSARILLERAVAPTRPSSVSNPNALPPENTEKTTSADIKPHVAPVPDV